jgi:hypothetical protein
MGPTLQPGAPAGPAVVLCRPGRLIIPLIIHTIRRDLSGSVGIDEASNLSSPDPSGADQIDAEHQAPDLALPEFVEPGDVAAGYRSSRSRSFLVSRSSM